MKEHFTASPRRVVSFFFLLLMILAIIKLLVTLLGLTDFVNKFEEKLKKIISSRFSIQQEFYDKGRSEGVALGYKDAKAKQWRAKKLARAWYKKHYTNPLKPKLYKRILNYVLFIVLLLEIMLAISSDSDFKMTDLDNSNINVTVNADTSISHDEKN